MCCRTVVPLLFLAVFLSLTVPPTFALDLTLPSDLFDYQVTIPGDVGDDAYYYIDPWAMNPGAMDIRGYLMVLDSEGEVVAYRDAGRAGHHSNFQPLPGLGLITHSLGPAQGPTPTLIRDEGFEIIDVLPEYHPNGLYELDVHELLVEEGGSYWTLWWEPQPIDMSQVIEGGQPDAIIEGHVIEHWSADHEILWSWRSLDHLDMLPITARLDSSVLYEDRFEHLHINSVDTVGESALIASSRELSVVFKIDRASGEVIWRLGGGPSNDFTFSGNTDIPIPFNFQHDARHLDNGHITVFDNGVWHDPPRSTAKEYAVDEDEMTAELVWHFRHDPPTGAFITGSHRITAEGHHLIGWGNMYPTVAATEVDESGETLWELSFALDDDVGRRPGSYRVRKADWFTPHTRPYVSAVRSADQIELVCNWFGHEDQVDAYRVDGGVAPSNLQEIGETATGTLILPDPDPLTTFFMRISALDGSGMTIGQPSEIVEIPPVESGLELIPVVNSIPASGGALEYSATATSALPFTVPSLTYWTSVSLPGGQFQIGPLTSVSFAMPAEAQVTVDGLTQQVPAIAPAGQYLFTGKIGFPGWNLYVADAFSFVKAGDAATIQPGDPVLDTRRWPAGGMPFDQPATAGSVTPPAEFALAPVHPNPFNARATVTVTLPHAGELDLYLVNTLGRRVMTVSAAKHTPGEHRFAIDASRLASGVYFARATLDGRAAPARKLVVVK